VEPRQFTTQFLEVIAGRNPQILISRRVVNHLELAEEAAFKIGRDTPRPRVLDGERAQPRVSKANDQGAALP